jgi:hypothetical protein
LPDLLQTTLPKAKLVRQLIAAAALAILGVFGGVHSLCFGQQLCHLIALCFEALALNFVPSNATWPSLTKPALWQSCKTWTNKPDRALK